MLEGMNQEREEGRKSGEEEKASSPGVIFLTSSPSSEVASVVG